MNPGPRAAFKTLTDAIGRGDSAGVENLIATAEREGFFNENLIRVGLQNGARKGFADIVNVLIIAGKRAGYLGEEGNLLRIGLQEAAKQGHEAVARVLLQHGARSDTFGDKGSSPLYWSVSQPQSKGHLRVTELLLESKADTEWRDDDGRTVFMSAAWRGHQEAMELLLRYDANVNAQDNRGRTVIHNLAADSRKSPRWNDKIVATLLRNPIDLDVTDKGQRTALHWAASTGKTRLVEQLLTRRRHPKPNPNLRSSRGKTALHLACDADPARPTIVESLLRHGADIMSTSEGGWTSIHYAAAVSGSVEVIKLLLGRSSALLNAQTLTGMTALHIASQAGNVDVVECLLSYPDTKIHAKDAFHCTPLLRAAGDGHKEVIQLLAPFNNTQRLSKYALDASKGFEGTVVDFRTGSHHQNIVNKKTVYDVLFGKDEKGDHLMTTQISNLKGSVNKPNFRWIHLPANNINWVEALICKAFVEEGATDVEGFKGVEKGFSAQHRGPKYHSHFMRPICQRSSRGKPALERLPVYGPMESALRASAARARARYTSSPERFGKSSSSHNSEKGEAKDGMPHDGTHDSKDSPGLGGRDDDTLAGSIVAGTVPATPTSTGSHRSGRRKRSRVIDALAENKGSTPRKVSGSNGSNKKETPRVGSFTIAEGSAESQVSSNFVAEASNIVLFLPYLHYESVERFTRMRDAIRVAETTSNADMRRPPTCHDEALVWAHLQSSTGLHIRRTLDQSYLHGIDTDDRDADQVVTRYCESKGTEPNMLMVDQVWMWILGPRLIITAFPQRWEQPKNDPLDVLEGIIRDLNNDIRSPVSNVYDLATLITARTCGVFDRHQPDNEQYQFLDMFESSIGSVSDQETSLYSRFYTASREVHAWLQGDEPEHGKTSERTLAPVHSRYPRLIESFLDIGSETQLLQEIKDIRGELGMISMVLNHQKTTLPTFCDAICEDLASSRSTFKLRDTKKRFEEQRKLVNSHLNEISRMISLAAVTEESLLNLLDLKQKQANAFEARFARDQAAGTVRQGQIILVFTLVTIVFLPITTIATFFTIPIADFPGLSPTSGLRLGYVAKYTFGIGLGISVLLIAIAFSINPIGAITRQVHNSIDTMMRRRPEKAKGGGMVFGTSAEKVGQIHGLHRLSREGRTNLGSEGRRRGPKGMGASTTPRSLSLDLESV